MFHEVRVNILEMNGKIQTLKMKIETIFKAASDPISQNTISVRKELLN